MLSSFGVKKAAHGIELAEIESENLHGYDPWLWWVERL